MEYGTNGLVINDELALLVQIVQSNLSERHTYEFVCNKVFEDTTKAIIGTNDNEEFGVCISSLSMARLAFSVFVDGVGIRRENGEFTLSDIKNEHSYDEHRRNLMVGQPRFKSDKVYQTTFLSEDGSNPNLIFTHDKEEGVNPNLTGQAHKIGLIEVFVWLETPKPLPPPNTMVLDTMVLDTNNYRSEERERGFTFDDNERNLQSRSLSKKSYVGEGTESHLKYSTTGDLYKPEFIGKATFIHQNHAAIEKEYPMRIIHKPSARIARTDFSKYL